MATIMPSKDPQAVEPYFIVWCDEDGTNDGTASDRGELQGASLASSTWTVPTGITKDSSNTDAVTINGVAYDADTVSTIWVSAGTANKNYACHCVIVTDDVTPRTLEKTIIIPVRAH
jgi:hypothetical protein